MSAQIINLADYREDRFIERFYELMVGDLDAPAVAILETMETDEIELFMRLRKRVKARIAASLVGQHIEYR